MVLDRRPGPRGGRALVSPGDANHEADPFLVAVITQSLISTLPSSEDRETLLAELEEADRLRPTFLTDLRGMGAEARSVADLLANKDPRRFGELYAGLSDGVRANLEELSPLTGDERVTVTDALDHAELRPSFRDLPAFLRVNGFVVHSLRDARGGPAPGIGTRRSPPDRVPPRPRR